MIESLSIEKSKVGILIVFFNDLDKIEVLAKALKKQTYKNFLLFIIDNQPEVGHITHFLKHFPACRVLNSDFNVGFARGNNLLANIAIKEGCEYLWILNPDMEPEAESLQNLVNFMNCTPAAGIAGPLLIKGNTKKDPIIQLFGSKANYKTQKKSEFYAGVRLNEIILPDKMEVELLNAGSLLIKSEIIKMNYLFEERYFMYNDEIDLANRVHNLGFKLYAISTSKVWHHHNWSQTNKKGYNLMYYYMLRNRMLYYIKHSLFLYLIFDVLKKILYWPLILKFSMKTSSISLFKFYYLGLLHGLLNRQGKAELKF